MWVTHPLVLTTVKVRKPKGATWFLHSAEPVRPVSSNYWSYLSLLGVTPRISQDERSSVIAHESTPSVSMIIALEHRSRVKRTSFKLGRKSEERSSLLHRVRTCGYCAAGLSQQITSFILIWHLPHARGETACKGVAHFIVAPHVKAMPASVSDPDIIS